MLSLHDTPGGWLQRAVRRWPHHKALICVRGGFSYRQLWRHLSAYQLPGPPQGATTLALITHSRALCAIGILAGTCRGVPVLALSPASARPWESTRACGASHVLTDLKPSPRLPARIRVLPLRPHPGPGPALPVPSAGPLLYIATSGTTAAPRIAALTGTNLAASARMVNERLALGTGDVWLNCLPPYHIGGASILFRCLRAGATMVLHEEFDPEHILGDMDRHRVTHISLVPAMLARLLDTSAGARPPAALRSALIGGGPLSGSLARRALRSGWPLRVSYGMTETASAVTIGEPVQPAWQAGCTGSPLPGVAVRLPSHPGGPLRDRIMITGPVVFAGYAGATRRTRPALPRTTFLSRDEGWLDTRGRLHVLGRTDEVIVSAGVNIHPEAVEEQFSACPGVREIAVCGIDDPVWGQRLVAVVAGTANAAELDAWGRRHLASPHRPRLFLHIESLPRTPLGKPDRPAIRQWLSAGADRGGD